MSASGRSLVQRSATECDREPSIIRRPWPYTVCCAMVKISCKDRTAVIQQIHTVDLEQRCGRQITVQGKLLQKSVDRSRGVNEKRIFYDFYISLPDNNL